MRTARRPVLAALLAIQPFWLLAASYASKRDPVGEKVYASGSLWRMAPVAIIAGGLVVAWLLARARRKRDGRTSLGAGSQHG
jgi:hypothetical protein